MGITHEKVGKVLVAKISGRLDSAAAPQIKSALNRLIEEGNHQVVVDLAEVPFVDSAGLAALISAYKRARQGNGDLVLAAVPQSVRIILELTRLHRVFEIVARPEDAVARLT